MDRLLHIDAIISYRKIDRHIHPWVQYIHEKQQQCALTIRPNHQSCHHYICSRTLDNVVAPLACLLSWPNQTQQHDAPSHRVGFALVFASRAQNSNLQPWRLNSVWSRADVRWRLPGGGWAAVCCCVCLFSEWELCNPPTQGAPRRCNLQNHCWCVKFSHR